jgi:hypothetical protein
LLIVAALAAAARFGVAVYRAPATAQGDFLATLPGAYAGTLNPTLWNSDDLRSSLGFHRDIYLYGPTQYLLLYPIVFLNSYAQIASVLGVVYLGVLSWSLYLLARLLGGLDGLDRKTRSTWTLLGVSALVLLLSPIQQAYIQREFEVVVLLCIVAATYLLMRRQERWAGALLGAMTWFKLWPIVFLGYFLGKRQFKAVAGFVLASCVTLALAHLLFGLDRFVIFNPAITPNRQSVATLLPPLGGTPSFYWKGVQWFGTGFCTNWFSDEQTFVGIPWAACWLAYAHPSFPAVAMYYGLGALGLAAGLLGFALLEGRAVMTEEERRWSILLELSLVTIAGALFLRAHYYYFLFLALPFSGLTYHYVRDRPWKALSCLALAYVLLALPLPISLISRVFGVDFWRFYIEHVIYLYGELILTTLILWEYIAVGLASSSGKRWDGYMRGSASSQAAAGPALANGDVRAGRRGDQTHE